MRKPTPAERLVRIVRRAQSQRARTLGARHRAPRMSLRLLQSRAGYPRGRYGDYLKAPTPEGPVVIECLSPEFCDELVPLLQSGVLVLWQDLDGSWFVNEGRVNHQEAIA